jgi:tetratricopeptide (TPR) repeat protein
VRPCLRVLSLFIGLVASAAVWAQQEAKSNPQRDHAFDLYKQGKMVEAMPLLEELSAGDPKDIAVMESWGASVLGYAQTLSDADLKKKARVRARTILLKAQALGDNSDFLQTLLRDLPEDGFFNAFSDKKDVDDAMQAAEADFARGDLDKARQGYTRAFLLDGKQYYAALFIGDTYYKQQKPAYAGQWFSQAIRIDPDKETAYRYWGDALLHDGRLNEAREKYIDAIVADPYNGTSWNGLKNWVARTRLNPNWLKLKEGVAVENKEGKTNVTMDSSLPTKLSAAWLAYGMNHALWMNEKFKKEFPKESAYRHSLKEEREGLEMFLSVAGAIKDEKGSDKTVDAPSRVQIEQLIKIKESGFLEPFALLNRADSGIARDYAGYREAHRDTIRRYFDEFVVPKPPAVAEEQAH